MGCRLPRKEWCGRRVLNYNNPISLVVVLTLQHNERGIQAEGVLEILDIFTAEFFTLIIIYIYHTQ